MLEARGWREQRQQRRLLDVYDASVGARGETRQVSDLFDGLGPGHEEERERSKVVVEAERREGEQVRWQAEKYERYAWHARHERGHPNQRVSDKRVCRSGRTAAADRSHLRDG